MKTVSIFGGLGSKLKHFEIAIEIYKKYGYKIIYVPNTFYDLSVVNPSLYKKNVLHIIHQLNHNQNNIIHTSCGGFWAGLYLNTLIQHKGFVIESGPLEADPKRLLTALNFLTKNKLIQIGIRIKNITISLQIEITILFFVNNGKIDKISDIVIKVIPIILLVAKQ